MRLHAKPAKDKTAGLIRLGMGWVLMLSMALVPGNRALYAPDGAEALAADTPRQHKVIAYVQDMAGLSLREEDAPYLDQVNYAFALLKDGKAHGDHWKSVHVVKDYLQRHPHITGVISVGGWGAEGFSDAASTPEGRETLARSMLQLMDAHGFRGLDVDWEYPATSAGGLKHRADDWENYFQLLALLREGLDARAEATGQVYVLSVALGASDSLIQAVDGTRLGALVDQANIMTYDFTGFDAMTGHHAALYPAGDNKLGGAYAINAYAAQGIPTEKLNLGCAFYGRAWRDTPAENNGLHQRAGTTGSKYYTYDQLQSLLTEEKYTRYYDAEAQSPWLFDGSTFISYEDASSLRAKAAYVRANSLHGIFCWALDHDTSGELLRAMGEK